MGLKDDLIKAEIESLKLTGVSTDSLNTSNGSPLDVKCELTKEAIIKLLESAEFRVTKFVAPVILEDLKVPDQSVDIDPDALHGPYAPIIDAIGKVATAVGNTELGDIIETTVKKIVKTSAESGATLPELDLGKDVGGLESTGYTFIGEDPDSNKVFNVDDEDGQRLHTTVKFFRGDNEELL